MQDPSLSNQKKCSICFENKDDLEEFCKNKHIYCIECINQTYENMIFERKEINNKCSICKEFFFENKLEAFLYRDVKEQLIKLCVFEVFSIPDDFLVMKCNLCPNEKEKGLFLVKKTNFSHFYTCENEGCKKTMCTYCYKEKIDENHHQDCKNLYPVLQDLEKVVEFSITKHCPKCVKTGREIKELQPNMKNSGCSHIKCGKCNMYWCYICGGHEENIDKCNKDLNKSLINRHNIDWVTNAKRCPMYVKEFASKIEGYSKNESDCCHDFDAYRLKSFIKKVVAKYGFEKVNKANNIYSERLKHISDEYFNENEISKFKKIDILEQKIFSINKIN
jgi:hypothetical protein